MSHRTRLAAAAAVAALAAVPSVAFAQSSVTVKPVTTAPKTSTAASTPKVASPATKKVTTIHKAGQFCGASHKGQVSVDKVGHTLSCKLRGASYRWER